MFFFFPRKSKPVVPGVGVVEDECVDSRVPGFKLALNGLFVRVTPCQWDQNLREERKKKKKRFKTEIKNKINVNMTRNLDKILYQIKLQFTRQPFTS